MSKVSRRAMEFCVLKCYQDLNKYIERDLYGVYSPTMAGLRTRALLNAWQTEAGVLKGELTFMEGGQHQSAIGGDALGDALIDVLESGYRGLNAKTGKRIPSRRFWQHWVKHADKMVGKWYAQGLRAQGLKVIGR